MYLLKLGLMGHGCKLEELNGITRAYTSNLTRNPHRTIFEVDINENRPQNRLIIDDCR